MDNHCPWRVRGAVVPRRRGPSPPAPQVMPLGFQGLRATPGAWVLGAKGLGRVTPGEPAVWHRGTEAENMLGFWAETFGWEARSPAWKCGSSGFVS